MDLIHQILNITLPFVSLISLIIVLPILSFYRVVRFCIRSVFPENLAGKVVIITGASSGIGEHLAYEYAKHGACLALVARRKELLVAVAQKAEELGSPKAIVIKADVSSLEDCKTIVDETIQHFGKLDCLINNAGIGIVGLFEEQKCITGHVSTMDINFWGSVNVTHFALPHLRKSKGRIVVISSCGGWFGTPKVSVYNASKAAQQSFFETLRIEVAPDIGITMVTPGIINTPLTNQDCFLYETSLDKMPSQSAEGCAKAIVNSARRGDEYLTEPQWMRAMFLWVMLLPEVMNSVRRFLMVTSHKPKFQKWKSYGNTSLQPLDISDKEI